VTCKQTYFRTLTHKGASQTSILAYDTESEVKGETETNLRFIIQSALEIVDAYDSEKFATYSPDKALPVQSTLRFLKD